VAEPLVDGASLFFELAILSVTLSVSDVMLVMLPAYYHLPVLQSQITLILSRDVVAMCITYIIWCCMLPNNECPVYWRWLRTFLSSRFLYTGAAVSYSAYLWHWMVLIVAVGSAVLGDPTLDDKLNLHLLDLQYTSKFLAVSVVFALVSAITFVIAAFSYVFVEKPFLSLRP